MVPPFASDLAGTWWLYLLLFAAVAASWAGVPVVGAAALGAAGVAASQGHLDLLAVIVVATLGGEVGGLIGYAIGDRWGRRLMERPGKHRAGRQKMVERGERAYAHWGRLAVFFTPAIVSGTAKMPHGQFALWNLFASLAFTLGVSTSAYGIGSLLAGHHTVRDVLILAFGLAISTGITVLLVRRHRRWRSDALHHRKLA